MSLTGRQKQSGGKSAPKASSLQSVISVPDGYLVLYLTTCTKENHSLYDCTWEYLPHKRQCHAPVKDVRELTPCGLLTI